MSIDMPGPHFEITNQQEVVDVSQPGAPVRAMEVTFRVPDAQTTASVRIPLANYSAAEVVREVTAYANKILEVAHLNKG